MNKYTVKQKIYWLAINKTHCRCLKISIKLISTAWHLVLQGPLGTSLLLCQLRGQVYAPQTLQLFTFCCGSLYPCWLLHQLCPQLGTQEQVFGPLGRDSVTSWTETGLNLEIKKLWGKKRKKDTIDRAILHPEGQGANDGNSWLFGGCKAATACNQHHPC